jgi:coniferyl-aldehyde dehydrogenase
MTATTLAAPQRSPEEVRSELEDCLTLQRKAYLARPAPSYEERKADLEALLRFVKDNKDAIIAAISADYGNRSLHESLMVEVFPAIESIEYTIGNLKKWMKPQKRHVDMLTFMGATNKVIPQPLGVVGVLVPWNFPINLSITPLAQILAAGNRAMVKMSENSINLTRLMIKKFPAYFPREKITIFEETGGVGIEFSQLPFDHILFTGSGQTGKSVMAAAAKNLCPVTLELGGKSPAVVLPDFSLHKAAERILYVKYLNAGQICTTVDYLWLPKGKTEEFVTFAKEIVSTCYPSLDTPDYTSIIDDKSFKRLTNALLTAQAAGATLVQLVPGEPWDAATRKISPHIVLNLPEDHELMEREIFGPILPIREYASLEDVIDYINAHSRPLALYPFSESQKKVQMLIDHVLSGGVSVNDALFHVGQHDLPFGGVGGSGMGHYHGYEGFLTFSKLRPVFYQSDFSTAKYLRPPYGNLANTALNYLTK